MSPVELLNQKIAFSVSEAARILGVSENHVYDLVSEGEIRGVRIGRKLIITRNEIGRIVGTENLPALAASR
jgi:excisionase family DNA binding protein